MLVQGRCRAQGTPLEARMAAWSEEDLLRFFTSGIAPAPRELQQNNHAPALRGPAPTPVAHPDRTALAAHGPEALVGDVWRRDAAVRKSHWLCQPCNVALPRTTAACAVCNAADFSSSNLTPHDVDELADQLRLCAIPLQTLNMSHNPLGAAGVRALVPTLAALPSLTRLDLSATCAADGGAIAVADSLISSRKA